MFQRHPVRYFVGFVFSVLCAHLERPRLDFHHRQIHPAGKGDNLFPDRFPVRIGRIIIVRIGGPIRDVSLLTRAVLSGSDFFRIRVIIARIVCLRPIACLPVEVDEILERINTSVMEQEHGCGDDNEKEKDRFPFSTPADFSFRFPHGRDMRQSLRNRMVLPRRGGRRRCGRTVSRHRANRRNVRPIRIARPVRSLQDIIVILSGKLSVGIGRRGCGSRSGGYGRGRSLGLAQRFDEIGTRFETVHGIFAHGLFEGRLRVFRQRLDRFRRLVQHRFPQHGHIRGVKRQISGDHFVGHHGERVLIRGGVLLPSAPLFRRHVGSSAARTLGHHADAGHARVDLSREAEIQHFHMFDLVDHDVAGLDIAMNDLLLVGIIKRGGNLTDDRKGRFQIQTVFTAFPPDPGTQVLPRDAFHDEIIIAVGIVFFQRVVTCDVRMVEIVNQTEILPDIFHLQ